jgi:hypothetical protein
VNGDGYGDIAIVGNAAVTLDGGGVISVPRIYVYLGGTIVYVGGTIVDTPDASLPGPPHSYIARDTITLANACDVNGDGYADLVAGSQGGVVTYQGGPGGLGSDSVSMVVPGLDEYTYSFRIASAGDLDGDGYDDIVASYDMLYVYPGGAAGLPGSPSLMVTPPNDAAGIYGYELAAAGDADGDGFADLAVGAPFDRNWIGRAYLFRGTASGMANAPATTMSGTAAAGAQLGCVVK